MPEKMTDALISMIEAADPNLEDQVMELQLGLDALRHRFRTIQVFVHDLVELQELVLEGAVIEYLMPHNEGALVLARIDTDRAVEILGRQPDLQEYTS